MQKLRNAHFDAVVDVRVFVFSSDPYTSTILEPLLAANRDNYLAGPHSLDRQQAALTYFDQQWAHLRSSAACGGATLGKAGRQCIADRSRTAQGLRLPTRG